MPVLVAYENIIIVPVLANTAHNLEHGTN